MSNELITEEIPLGTNQQDYVLTIVRALTKAGILLHSGRPELRTMSIKKLFKEGQEFLPTTPVLSLSWRHGSYKVKHTVYARNLLEVSYSENIMRIPKDPELGHIKKLSRTYITVVRYRRNLAPFTLPGAPLLEEEHNAVKQLQNCLTTYKARAIGELFKMGDASIPNESSTYRDDVALVLYPVLSTSKQRMNFTAAELLRVYESRDGRINRGDVLLLKSTRGVSIELHL